MPTVQSLVDSVVEEAAFDVSPTLALQWLSRRHARMIVQARALRKTVDVGPTVPGQRDYALPAELVEVAEVLVGGAQYGRGSHGDLAVGAQGYLLLSGSGGLVVPEESVGGAAEIALYPTPTGAVTLTVRGIFRPAPLSVSDDSTLLVTEEFHDALIAGAVATGLRRVEHRPDLAQPHEEEFTEGIGRLAQQARERYRGTGPAQIRVVGYNA